MRDQVEQDEITQDQNGSIYPQPSIFDHFEETFLKRGDDKPATNVTGGTFAVEDDNNAS